MDSDDYLDEEGRIIADAFETMDHNSSSTWTVECGESSATPTPTTNSCMNQQQEAQPLQLELRDLIRTLRTVPVVTSQITPSSTGVETVLSSFPPQALTTIGTATLLQQQAQASGSSQTVPEISMDKAVKQIQYNQLLRSNMDTKMDTKMDTILKLQKNAKAAAKARAQSANIDQTGERIYDCQLCPEKFIQKEYLIEHVESVHLGNIRTAFRTAFTNCKQESMTVAKPVMSTIECPTCNTQSHQFIYLGPNGTIMTKTATPQPLIGANQPITNLEANASSLHPISTNSPFASGKINTSKQDPIIGHSPFYSLLKFNEARSSEGSRKPTRWSSTSFMKRTHIGPELADDQYYNESSFKSKLAAMAPSLSKETTSTASSNTTNVSNQLVARIDQLEKNLFEFQTNAFTLISDLAIQVKDLRKSIDEMPGKLMMAFDHSRSVSIISDGEIVNMMESVNLDDFSNQDKEDFEVINQDVDEKIEKKESGKEVIASGTNHGVINQQDWLFRNETDKEEHNQDKESQKASKSSKSKFVFEYDREIDMEKWLKK